MRDGLGLTLGIISGTAALLAGAVLIGFGSSVNVFDFLIFLGVTTTGACAMATSPKIVAHALSALLGVGALVGSVAAFASGMTPVLPITLMVFGFLLGGLSFMSINGSRPAWSFLVAITAVLFICMFFGAPKVKSVIGISIWFALIAPGLLITATAGLGTLHRNYDTTAA